LYVAHMTRLPVEAGLAKAVLPGWFPLARGGRATAAAADRNLAAFTT
jgi:hypothetical protein